METSDETETGICHECSVKDGDYSQKKVYHCELCNNWFCEEHQIPKVVRVPIYNIARAQLSTQYFSTAEPSKLALESDIQNRPNNRCREVF